MPREVPALDPGQVELIAEVLSRWGEVHPRPEMPIIQLADGSELTPRDISAAVRGPDSRRGRLLFRVFAVALVDDGVEPSESLERMLTDFERDADEWERAR